MTDKQTRYWLHHVAFCRHHEFDHKTDLEPQFKEAFEVYGHDFMQVRGSVSLSSGFLHDYINYLGCPYGDVPHDVPLSSRERHRNDK